MIEHDVMDVVGVQPGDAEAPGIARVSKSPEDRYPPAPMVGWYDPGQLARTGASVAVSTLFSRNADRRLLEVLDAPLEYFDYAVDDTQQPRRELWIDYVADTGDGFNSTYAVASAVARDKLEVADPLGKTYTTHRGRVLVFGGDEVYPVASRQQYEQRLVMPYELALPHSSAPHPDVYAIPGNHDWYDSLIAFTRRFCSKRWFAGWRTQQRTSYFALRLPHDWWLLGTDVQLDSDIDADQVRYFKAIADKMAPEARIILCNAEPHWIYQQTDRSVDRTFLRSNLEFLEHSVLRRKISVFLSGDLHHYRRHSDFQHHHKIVAGGGGAFLHPTHGVDVSKLKGDYTLCKSYPEIETSRALTKRNFLFPLLNWRFGLVTALLYLLTCRAIQVDLSGFGLHDIGPAASAVLASTLRGPTEMFWIALVVTGVILFTDLGSMRYRLPSGLLHATAHLAAVFFIGWGASWLVAQWQMPVGCRLLSSGALIFATGWIVGSLMLGSYLFVSLNWLGRHINEAFSSLAIPDWKNFLRLHIDQHGTLRIYPIGIDRVPRRWQPESHGPRLVSSDPKATPPRLIEAPIEVPAGRAPAAPPGMP